MKPNHPLRQVILGFLLAALSAFTSTQAHASLLADSVAGYSGVQGQNGWNYGYYASPFNSSTFTQMTTFSPSGGLVPNAWWVDVNTVTSWTNITQLGGHPDTGTGPNSGGWAVRRWTSNYAGMANLSGTVGDLDPKTNIGSDGVITDIFVDGVQVFTRTINNAAANSTYNFNTSLSLNSKVDFVIEPRTNFYYDTTLFTAQIAAVPEPGTALFGIACVGVAAFRRRRSAVVA